MPISLEVWYGIETSIHNILESYKLAYVMLGLIGVDTGELS